MATRGTKKPDPLERTIEVALEPGRFIGWRDRFSFVEDLDNLAERLAVLIGSEPARAAALHETFIAGCFEKASEVHNEGGSFGEFVGSLFAGWVTARQAIDADANETARQLLVWTDDDPYCLAFELERHVAKILDRKGAAAFERLVCDRLAGRASTPGSAGRDPEVRKRRWGEVLRVFYSERRNLRGYISVAEETEVTAKD